MELQKELSARGISLPIIFVTAEGEISTAVEAVKAGAVDFIQKPFPHEKLLAKVHEALERDARLRALEKEQEEVDRRIDTLTRDEGEVMALMALGREIGTICEELGLEKEMVSELRARVMEKMNAGSESELARLVLKTGGNQ